MEAHIYKITNLINNKIYIGFTVNIDRRINEHFGTFLVRSNFCIHRAIRKYGKENFTFEIIYTGIDINHTKNIMEPIFIHVYNSHSVDGHGYNMTYGGEGSPGRVLSEQTKAKIALGNTGKKMSPEAVEKTRIASTGRRHTKETKLIISQKQKGIPKKKPTPFKHYKLTYIDESTEIIIGMKNTCKERSYSYGEMFRLINGETKKHKNIVKVERL